MMQRSSLVVQHSSLEVVQPSSLLVVRLDAFPYTPLAIPSNIDLPYLSWFPNSLSNILGNVSSNQFDTNMIGIVEEVEFQSQQV